MVARVLRSGLLLLLLPPHTCACMHVTHAQSNTGPHGHGHGHDNLNRNKFVPCMIVLLSPVNYTTRSHDGHPLIMMHDHDSILPQVQALLDLEHQFFILGASARPSTLLVLTTCKV